MFISQTTTRRTANKTYRSIRLVESRRVGRKVQQKTLLKGVIPIWTPFLIWHILSPIETFATVEAMSESRIFEDLPVIICSNFGWIPVLF